VQPCDRAAGDPRNGQRFVNVCQSVHSDIGADALNWQIATSRVKESVLGQAGARVNSAAAKLRVLANDNPTLVIAARRVILPPLGELGVGSHEGALPCRSLVERDPQAEVLPQLALQTAHVWADRFDGERSKVGRLQVEIVARLANSLDVALTRTEALRAIRERPNNPDAVDLSMRGWMERLNGSGSKENQDAVVGLFERALALDPKLVPAMVGLARALVDRVTGLISVDPKSDIQRAEDWADQAVKAEPDNSNAHMAKANVFFAKRQWAQVIPEVETAIAANPNNAEAIITHSFWKMFTGRSEDGFSGLETAFRLSPRDPSVPSWQFYTCHLHTHLAQWEQAIEWCNKSIVGDPEDFYPLVDLAAANAWTGHDKEAKEAVAQLQKVYPGFTVQTWAGIDWTDDQTFKAQYARIVEGLRKSGLPEGEAKSN
jgi:adenylate cyclase